MGFEPHHALGLDISKGLDAEGLGGPQHEEGGETYAQVWGQAGHTREPLTGQSVCRTSDTAIRLVMTLVRIAGSVFALF